MGANKHSSLFCDTVREKENDAFQGYHLVLMLMLIIELRLVLIIILRLVLDVRWGILILNWGCILGLNVVMVVRRGFVSMT